MSNTRNILAYATAALFTLSSCTLPKDGEPSSQRKSEDGSTSIDVAEAQKRLAAARAPWVSPAGGRTLEKAIADMRNRYRLKPDRRFLLAVSAIEGGLKPRGAAADCAFENGRWTISVGSHRIGSLSEFPNYDEMLSFLVKQASASPISKMAASPSAASTLQIQEQVDALAPDNLLSAIEMSAREWNQKRATNETLALAARALILLNLQKIDFLAVSDGAAAQAMAWLSVAEATGGKRLNREHALLAYSLGYFNDARKCAVSLSASDSIAPFVLNNLKELKTYATRPGASALDKYLYLNLLSANRRKDEWQQWVKSNYSANASMNLPILATFPDARHTMISLASFLMIESIESSGKPPNARKPLNLSRLSWAQSDAAESTTWMLRGLLPEFDSVAHKSDDNKFAPFLSNEEVYGLRRSYFASGTWFLSEAFRHLPSARKMCLDFTYAQKVAPQSPAGELKNFMVRRMELETKETSLLELMDELESMKTLGPSAALWYWVDNGWFREVKNRDSVFAAGHKLFQLMDSRANHRRALGDIARQGMVYRRLSKELIRAADNAGTRGNWNYQREFLACHSDRAKLKALLADARVQTDELLRMLKWVQSEKSLSIAEIAQEYAKLWKRDPNNWPVIEQCWRFLVTNNKLEEALKLIQSVLADPSLKSQATRTLAKCKLAEIYFLQKKYQEGLKTINSIADSEDFLWMRMKALLLQASGKREEAEDWVSELLKRYPSRKPAIALAAEIYWRNAKYSEAAQILAQSRQYLAMNDWGVFIFPAFFDVFANDATKGYLAVGAARDSRMVTMDTLGKISRDVYLNQRPELAFAILSAVSAEPGQNAQIVIEGYRYVRAWKGKQEALRWIKSQVKEEDRPLFADLIFGALGLSELLWEFVPEAPDARFAPRVWLLRAADLKSSNYQPSPAMRKRLTDYFRDHGKSLSDQMSRDLLAMTGSDSLKAKLSDRQLCFASFYKGLKSLRKTNNLARDLEWYRLAVELNQPQLHEYAWARGWLFVIEDRIAVYSPNAAITSGTESASIFVDSMAKYPAPKISVTTKQGNQ